MLIDSRRLLYFLRIVEYGSFSKAAKSLGVAQPALSHHVRLMEEHLGVSLLVRRSRGVEITEEGQDLLRHARAIIERLEELELDLRSNSKEIKGKVNIGLASSVAAPLTPLLLKTIRSRHPEIVLRVIAGNSTALVELIKTEQIDFALNLELVVPHRSVRLFCEDLYLIGPAGSFNGRRSDTIEFKDAVSLPLILPTRPHSVRKLVEEKALERHLTVHTQFEVDGFEPIKAAIKIGMGYSILSWAAIQTELAAGQLSALRLVRPSIRRYMVLDIPPKTRLSRAAQATREILAEIVVDLFRSKTWRGQLYLPAAGERSRQKTPAI